MESQVHAGVRGLEFIVQSNVQPPDVVDSRSVSEAPQPDHIFRV